MRPSVINNFRYGYTPAHAHQVLLSVANAQETGSSLAGLLLGMPSGISKENVIPMTLYHHYGALFLQDDWRAAPRLTLNLGLRWDFETSTAETHDQVTLFDTAQPSSL